MLAGMASTESTLTDDGQLITASDMHTEPQVSTIAITNDQHLSATASAVADTNCPRQSATADTSGQHLSTTADNNFPHLSTVADTHCHQHSILACYKHETLLPSQAAAHDLAPPSLCSSRGKISRKRANPNNRNSTRIGRANQRTCAVVASTCGVALPSAASVTTSNCFRNITTTSSGADAKMKLREMILSGKQRCRPLRGIFTHISLFLVLSANLLLSLFLVFAGL